MSDQDYLLQDQYRDGSNLDARIQLHKRFSTNAYGWFPWLFDQLDLPNQCRILELGCGPGEMWRQNRDRIPPGWEITLSDFSEGMLEQARRTLGERFIYEVIDAQSIPFDDAALDAILAFHMLYHVPDRSRALAEMRRILKPGGRLYITSISQNHMGEVHELVARFDPGAKLNRKASGFLAFTLENGAGQLAEHFDEVALRRFDDDLLVTEAAPLADYLLSSVWHGAAGHERKSLVAFLEKELAASGGALHISKDSGLFTALRE